MAPLCFAESIVFPFKDKFISNIISDGTEQNKSKGYDKSSVGNKPKIKVENEHDDYNPQVDLNQSVHLCNKCWSTFVGIDAYLAHRNNGCEDSQVLIEGYQNSNKENAPVDTESDHTNLKNDDAPNNDVLCSREIKLEPLDTEEIQKVQESTNNIQTQDDRPSLTSVLSKHNEHNKTTDMGPQEKPNLNGGTSYINSNIPSVQQNIQWINEHHTQPVEKVSQNKENLESDSIKKRTMNVLSPEQLSLNTQPRKKIKMSDSSKQLSRELFEILRKQMIEMNNDSKNKQNSRNCSYSLDSTNELLRIKLSDSMESSKELDAALRKQTQDLNKPTITNVNYPETSIKLSDSMKLSNELDAALQKQMQDLNKPSIPNDNYPESSIKLSDSMALREQMLDAALQKQMQDLNKPNTPNVNYPETSIKLSDSMKLRVELLDAALQKQMQDLNKPNTPSVNYPETSIKLSDSMKLREQMLDAALQKQMQDLNKPNTPNVNYPETSIKLSDSMTLRVELLDAALQKQMPDLNKPDIPNVHYPETTSSESSDYKEADNLNLFQTSVHQIFYNKYSEDFKSRSEISNNYINSTRHKNNLSECKYTNSDENTNKSLKDKTISKSDSIFPDNTFENKIKNERFYNAIYPTRQRKSNFRANSLVIYNLNIHTRMDWLRTVFQRYGKVQNVNIRRYVSIKRAKGFVEFEKQCDADRAYQLCDGRIIDGAMIKLYFYPYALDSSPNCIGSVTNKFGRNYEARVTGNPSRHENSSRNQRPGPYNLF